MKVLVVCSGNSKSISPFIKEQVASLEKLGVFTDYYLIKGKGVRGYLKNIFPLRIKIQEFSPNIIHAHYGLSGLLASLQRNIPVVTTFHGSDINVKKYRIYSYFASKLSRENIFVHPALSEKINARNPVYVIPCGVDLDTFYPMDKKKSREIMKLKKKKKYGLFSSHRNNGVKNYPLAEKAASLVYEDLELIELKGYSRKEVNLLMNAVDFLLVTSYSETGPLVVKEAMACNCPIVATDVGDVKEIIGDTEGCYITSFDSIDVAIKIEKVSRFGKRTNCRERIIKYDNKNISKMIYSIYQKVLMENI